MATPKRSTVIGIVFLIAVIVVSLALFFRVEPDVFSTYLEGNPITVSLVFTLLVFTTTVIAPMAALPLAPLVSTVIGPFAVGVLSVLGWTLGAVVAFLLARHLGKPLLIRFVDMEKLEKYEAYVPQQQVFLWLVLLRVLIPVDVLSYAIGLSTTIRLSTYTLATAIGVAPFSFVWAYGGNAFFERNFTQVVLLLVAGLALFAFSFYMYYYAKRKNKKE